MKDHPAMLTGMAKRAQGAFTPETHEQLLALRKLGWGDVKLAAEFNVSVPTVRKWLKLPVGYVADTSGRKKTPVAETPGQTEPLEVSVGGAGREDVTHQAVSA